MVKTDRKFCSVKVPFKLLTRYVKLYCMLKYVLAFVNFIRNVRLSDQVFRIGSRKTERQVKAIIERDHPFAGGYLLS